ncbi:MAG: hypothetical protein ACR652_10170 [Methylocystis sp.]|uniref:hypothetical protein n=1 Tax=Methylocystis sp. TaxID=1911079 RepID=UPI003DA57177
MDEIPLSSIWGVVSPYLDGNWFDVLSLIGGIGYAVYRWRKCCPSRPFVTKETGIDVANGVGLFPLLMLSFSIISSRVLTEVLQSNRLILSVAGVVALLAILED